MSCAFVPCEQWLQDAPCSLIGGCVDGRFTRNALAPQDHRPASKARNDTGQPRPTRDPSKIQRRRKPITR